MELLFYYGTAVIAALALAVFLAGLVIARLPVDEREGRPGRKGGRR